LVIWRIGELQIGADLIERLQFTNSPTHELTN